MMDADDTVLVGAPSGETPTLTPSEALEAFERLRVDHDQSCTTLDMGCEKCHDLALVQRALREAGEFTEEQRRAAWRAFCLHPVTPRGSMETGDNRHASMANRARVMAALDAARGSPPPAPQKGG